MKTSFIIKESFRGFNSAKLSTTASVITVMLSLVLIAIYFTLSVNSNKFIKSLKDKVEVEFFLDENITPDEINGVKEKIRTIGGIKQITFISKDEAAKIFESEFGKEMLEVFESNPLPASLKLNLYDEYKTLDRITKIKSQIQSFPKVNDVIFPEKNLALLEKNTSGFLFINLVILIIITLSSLFLVSNTIRLVIASRKKIIQTFKLLGATNFSISLPFVIEGFLQGLLGGILAIVFLYIIFFYYTSRFTQNDFKIELISLEYLIYLLILGVILGILGSFFSVKKYLKLHV